MKVMSIVGARPQFVKLAPVNEALVRAGVDHVIVHTGQHYDHSLSGAQFEALGLPPADINLEIGSFPHGEQTGRMLIAVEPIINGAAPDWVVVYGDTNSTLAGALSAAKSQWPVAHVEAGLRSGNWAMPEEVNRVLADHASDLLLAPTSRAMFHLAREGLAARARLVGDVMADLVRLTAPRLAGLLPAAAPRDGYVVATLHRPANTDDPERLGQLVRQLAEVALPVLLLTHPRLRAAAQAHGIDLETGSIRVWTPVDHVTMLALLAGSRGLVTDSGGLQKEAYLLGVACTTVRAETEWPETLNGGMNVLDPTGEGIHRTAARQVSAPADAPFGDGRAAERIVDLLTAGAPAREAW